MEYRKLKELVEINSENITKNYPETTINYLDTSNITNGKIDNVIEIDIKESPSRAKRIVRKNDIIYSTVRPNLCHYGILRTISKNMIVSTGFVVLRCKKEILPEYLYAYITLPQITMKLHSIAETTTSAYPSIKPEDLGDLDISIPKIEIQTKIANILSCLDNKIELNNKINDNLFEYIENIYKEWFVKFTIFKNEEFKNSELGKIPVSCQVKAIYSIANIIYGAPFKSNLFNTEKKGIPIIRIRDLKNQEFKTYTEEKHPKGYLLKYGDIAVGMDGEFSPYIWGNSEAWLNQRICVFDNKRKKGKAFLFYTIKPLLKYVEATETATTVIHIGKNDFDKFKIILPNNDILNKFDDLTDPIIEKIINNIKENNTLTQLRDTLLPKLMNGEIDLDKIEI